MEGRSWQLDESKYKFTSKERDMESNYDYFVFGDSSVSYYTSKINDNIKNIEDSLPGNLNLPGCC